MHDARTLGLGEQHDEEPSGLARWSSWWTAPIPDYAPAFLRSEAAGYIISALAGILLSVGAGRLLGLLLARRETA